MAKSRVNTIRGKNPYGWSRRFDDPIALPDGGELTALKQASREDGAQDRTERAGSPDSAEVLTYAAEREIAWVFMARIATLRAIHRNQARVAL
jgi:hypothetical protein